MNFDFMDLDMYSKRIGLFYQSKDKISSKFGIFLTIIYIFTSLGLFIFYTSQTIQRTSINVHDSTMYLKESSNLNIEPNMFYFAFGVENPQTSARFIDETIYYPKVTFIEKVKESTKVKTVEEYEIEIERCKPEKFGDKYQGLLVEGELNNSYCIKDINLNLYRGFKLDRISYFKIDIFACVNKTENNNHCKTKELIDQYMSTTYISIITKDIGLDPSNYSDPIIPTLQNLQTTIGKGFFRDFVLYYGIAEVQTDIGLFQETIHKKNYINFIKSTQAIYTRDEDHFYNGEAMCDIQFKLGDEIRVQKRTFKKMTEVFAITGGYMQLIATIFKIISLLSNKLNSEIKIVNSLFNIYPEKNSISLKSKLQNKFCEKRKYFSLYRNKKSSVPSILNNNEISAIDKNNINKLNFNDYFIQSISNSENNIINSQQIKISKSINNQNEDNKKNINEKSKGLSFISENKSKAQLINLDFNFNSININNRIQNQNNSNNINKIILFDENDEIKSRNIKINIFYYFYFCFPKCKNYREDIKLFNLSLSFYKNKMDIAHLFHIILLIEKISKNNNTI